MLLGYNFFFQFLNFSMEELIQKGLPGVEQDTIQKVIDRLKDFGMVIEDDCEYVEESFLMDILKPIQLKKLLSFFSKFCSARKVVTPPVIDSVKSTENINLISNSPAAMQFSSSSDINDSSDTPSEPSTSKLFQFRQINKNWAEKFNIPWEIFSKEVIEACEQKRRLRKCILLEVVRQVAEKISRFNPSPGRKNLKIIAKKFTRKYPATFEDRCGNTIIADGGTTLAHKLEACLENRHRRKGFENLFEVESDQIIKKTVKNSYGCCNWQPNELPLGESKQSQIAHKNWLISESRKLIREECKIKELMKITYASQRCIANSKKSVKIIKEEWPVLFENNFFTAHASTLLGIEEISDKINKNIDVKGSIIYKFMNCTSKKDSVLECLKIINTAKEMGCEDAEILGCFLLLPAYFGEEKEELLQINMVSSTFIHLHYKYLVCA